MNTPLQDTISEAILLVTKATEEDRKRNYNEALQLYERSGEYFLRALNSETQSETTKDAIRAKCYLYLQRAEKIKTFLKNSKDNSSGSSATGNSGCIISHQESADNVLQTQIKNAIVTEEPTVKWADVVGLDDAKQTLYEAIKLPTLLPNYFAGQTSPWKGILLFGPSGTGKTYLARAVAAQAKSSTFFCISTSDLISKWMGESEKLMKHLFDSARTHKPSIIFIDEIDALCSQSEKDSETIKRLKIEFLLQMQGFRDDIDGIIVLAATTKPWLLDSALLGRFEKRIYTPLPGVSNRLSLFKFYSKTPLREEHYMQLAKKTNGYSGADISRVMKDASMQPLRKVQTSTHFKRVTGPNPTDPNEIVDGLLTPCNPDDSSAINISSTEELVGKLLVPQVSMEDILKSLQSIKPTVTKEELREFRKFRKEDTRSCSIV